MTATRRIGPRCTLGLLCAVLLVGCGAHPKLEPLDGDAVVLAFGDSLTHGTGAPDGAGYPAALARVTGLKVVNAGVPGELSGEGRERLPSVLREHRPELVVLIHGGNDIMRGVPAERTRAHVAAMVKTCREAGAQVVLMGVSGRNLTLDAAAFYAQVADELAVAADLETLPTLMRKPTLKSDRVHLNADGYARLADAVGDLLERHGAL